MSSEDEGTDNNQELIVAEDSTRQLSADALKKFRAQAIETLRGGGGLSGLPKPAPGPLQEDEEDATRSIDRAQLASFVGLESDSEVTGEYGEARDDLLSSADVSAPGSTARAQILKKKKKKSARQPTRQKQNSGQLLRFYTKESSEAEEQKTPVPSALPKRASSSSADRSAEEPVASSADATRDLGSVAEKIALYEARARADLSNYKRTQENTTEDVPFRPLDEVTIEDLGELGALDGLEPPLDLDALAPLDSEADALDSEAESIDESLEFIISERPPKENAPPPGLAESTARVIEDEALQMEVEEDATRQLSEIAEAVLSAEFLIDPGSEGEESQDDPFAQDTGTVDSGELDALREESQPDASEDDEQPQPASQSAELPARTDEETPSAQEILDQSEDEPDEEVSQTPTQASDPSDEHALDVIGPSAAVQALCWLGAAALALGGILLVIAAASVEGAVLLGACLFGAAMGPILLRSKSRAVLFSALVIEALVGATLALAILRELTTPSLGSMSAIAGTSLIVLAALLHLPSLRDLESDS